VLTVSSSAVEVVIVERLSRTSSRPAGEWCNPSCVSSDVIPLEKIHMTKWNDEWKGINVLRK
jgi:hypothetical protein